MKRYKLSMVVHGEVKRDMVVSMLKDEVSSLSFEEVGAPRAGAVNKLRRRVQDRSRFIAAGFQKPAKSNGPEHLGEFVVDSPELRRKPKDETRQVRPVAEWNSARIVLNMLDSNRLVSKRALVLTLVKYGYSDKYVGGLLADMRKAGLVENPQRGFWQRPGAVNP